MIVDTLKQRAPLFAELPHQYVGRFIVELWDHPQRGHSFAFTYFGPGFIVSGTLPADFRERAAEYRAIDGRILAAVVPHLRNAIATGAAPSSALPERAVGAPPLTGPDGHPNMGDFMGRIVTEIWQTSDGEYQFQFGLDMNRAGVDHAAILTLVGNQLPR
jgi:hypothetical protein